MGTVATMVTAGRFVERRLRYAVELLRTEGIDIKLELVTKGWLTSDYRITFTGTPAQAEMVDAVLEEV
jgi:hypothetical protein